MDKGLVIKDLFCHGLNPVSLTVSDGKCVVMHGPSGSGKSLFLRAVADLDANEGQIYFNGEDREKIPAPEWRKRAVYLQSETGWWHDQVGPHFSNLDDVKAVAETFGLSEEIFAWQIRRLSTGEKQRLALAMVLASNPPLLLLDEPTSALDPETTNLVELELKKRLDCGTIILMATHDRDQMSRMASTTLAFRDGRATEEKL